MRRESDLTLHCPIRVADRIVCDDLKAAVQLETDSDLVRAALYHLAVFVLGHAAVSTETFRLRGAGQQPASRPVQRATGRKAS